MLKLKPATPRTFPAARFGDSATLRRGDVVLAMGSPLALSQSVTRGIVSNTDMMMPQAFGGALGLLDGEDVGIDRASGSATTRRSIRATPADRS